MTQKAVRTEFVINDLAFSIGASGRGGTWLPAEDTVTPPTPISPVASVVFNVTLFEAVRAAVVEAVKAKKYGDIGGAFAPGATGGSPVIRAAIQEIGAAVVASAAFAALGGQGYPNPDDPDEPRTSLSPVVNIGRAFHRVNELPRLKAQLAATLAYVDKVAAAQAPRGAEIAEVRAQLTKVVEGLAK